jgi:hypothetical protein
MNVVCKSVHTSYVRYKIDVKNFLKQSLRKNMAISICMSRKDIRKLSAADVYEYTEYQTRVENMYDELVNEIMYDLETCAEDYPECYIGINVEPPIQTYSSTEPDHDNTLIVHYP